MHSINKKKILQEESNLFSTTRNYTVENNDLLTERDVSPLAVQKKIDKKDGVISCRKPIILKGNLPSVFDIDKLKIIKRYLKPSYIGMKEEILGFFTINIEFY